MGNGKWVDFSFLIYRGRNGKWEIGQFPISHLEKSKSEMRNEVDYRFRANEKWEMGCFTYFPFDIRQIGNRVNGISPDL